MRRVLLIVSALVVLAGGGFAGYDAWGPGFGGRPAASGASGAGPAALPTRPPVLAPHTAPATVPSPDAVTAALRRPARARGLGRDLVGSVIDLDTGTTLWSHRPGTPVPPASNAKLLTAAAALTVLGPDAHLTTRTARAGRTVWLIGGGDVTLASTTHPPAAAGPGQEGNAAAAAYPEPATLPSLASQTARALRAAGLHRVRVRYDTTAETGRRLAPGWKPTYVSEGDVAPPAALEVDEGRASPLASPRVDDPAGLAAGAFAHALADDGVKVEGEPSAAPAPVTATPLAQVASPTVAALVQQMLTNSDNDLAETFARAVARHAGRPGSFAAGAASIVAADRRLGLPMSGVRLVDGSGLSRQDRVSPRTLLAVLRLVASGRQPQLAAIAEGLPVAGFSGTLAGRYGPGGPAAPGAGLVRAKTGTLTGISSLSGLISDRSGDLLGFSLIAPRTASAELAEPALDRLASTLARCGCRHAT